MNDAPFDDGGPKSRRRSVSGPTSADVARLAGVSRSTVSRTFTPGASIDPVTAARVRAAAEELRYSVDPLARSLISRRSDTVGLVMGGLENPFYPAVAAGFMERLQQRDLRVMCHVAADIEAVADGVRAMLRYRVDALIVTASGMSNAAVDDCRRAGVTVIFFNRAVTLSAASSVQTDNVAGGRAVADHLAACGYARPAYVAGLANASTNRDRQAGFTDRLAERRLPAPRVESGGYTYEGGCDAATRLLRTKPRPDAIFCANDIMAMGVLDTLRHAHGLSVPDDMAVVGFDDVPMAAWPSFDLTTVRQRRNRMIEVTLDLLDDLRGDAEAPPVHRLIPGRLILRSSTRSP